MAVTVFLFPGQGAQHAGMLRGVAHLTPAVAQEAEQVLSAPLANLDTAAALRSTANVQLALLIAGVATARALQVRGVAPDFVAGHSVGAFGAAVVSGALAFADALRLVQQRGQLMARAYPNGYGLAAVLGVREARLATLLAAHNQANSPIYLANCNAADQLVVAGRTNSLTAFTQHLLATREARKATVLDVAVPSHCPLLAGVATTLHEALAGIQLREPTVPTIANHTGRLLRTAAAIRHDLGASLALPVRWDDATTLLYELGARCFIEMAPGTVLTKLAEAALPDVALLPAAELPLDTLAYRWQRQQLA